jgi:hypothetical protein
METFPTLLKAIIIGLERHSTIMGFSMCSCLYTLHRHPVIHYDLQFNRAVLENLSDSMSKNGNYQGLEHGRKIIQLLFWFCAAGFTTLQLCLFEMQSDVLCVVDILRKRISFTQYFLFL